MSEHAPHLLHPKYRPDIDGLRAIAVMSVIGFHAFPSLFQGGFIGVDIFFVISGFLISGIIFENLDKGEFTFSEFYARRIRRIFPALLLVMGACLIFGWFSLLTDEFKQLGKHAAGGASFISNFLLWQESGYFDNSAETKPLLHLWSLAIEEQFYIIWPLLLWFTWKRKFNFLAITLLIAAGSFYLNISNVLIDPVATFYSPLTRFWELMCGGLLAWIAYYKTETISNLKKIADNLSLFSVLRDKEAATPKALVNLSAFTGTTLLAIGFLTITKDSHFPGMWALAPVIGATLLIFAGPEAWINKKLLSTKLLVWLGLISYPLYLWHWPLLSFARIVENDIPSRSVRIGAVFISIVLAWLTMKYVEKPFRYGNHKIRLKVITLCALMVALGFSGLLVNHAGTSVAQNPDELMVKRGNRDYLIGSSAAWYKGKDNWLFLGNQYNNTVAKLMLSTVPTDTELKSNNKLFSDLAETAAKSNTQVALLLGPNKSSIYPEYLPDKFEPSLERYSSIFLDNLESIPNLTIYDPTANLLQLKKTEGILYWKTDTHWNHKGSFFAFAGLLEALNLPAPSVKFNQGNAHSGDLIKISELTDFPLSAQDNWDVIWPQEPIWKEKRIRKQEKTTFGVASIVRNRKALSDKYIWVIGDSFTGSLRQYFNATFKEVRYVGHWSKKLHSLPDALERTERKPDLIIIVRVERSF